MLLRFVFLMSRSPVHANIASYLFNIVQLYMQWQRHGGGGGTGEDAPHFSKVGKIVKEKWHEISWVYLWTEKLRQNPPPHFSRILQSWPPLSTWLYCKLSSRTIAPCEQCWTCPKSISSSVISLAETVNDEDEVKIERNGARIVFE